MYQKIRNLVFHTLIPAVLAALMLPTLAFAQESSCSVQIPVEIQTAGDRYSGNVTYKLRIEPITQGAPMPANPELVMVNGGSGAFEPMVYTVPADYRYRIYQTSEAQNRFTYDKTVYIVTVRVLNDGTGGLTAQIWAANEASGETKAEGIRFVNSYDRPGGGGGGGSDGGGGGTPSGGGDGLTEINEEGTPLAPGGGILDMIPDELVPTAMLPKTGDTTNLMLWIVLALLSGGGLAALILLRKREDY